MYNVTEGLHGVPLRGAVPQVMGWRRSPEAVMCTERCRKHLQAVNREQHGQGWLRKIPRGERTVVAREEVGAVAAICKWGGWNREVQAPSRHPVCARHGVTEMNKVQCQPS